MIERIRQGSLVMLLLMLISTVSPGQSRYAVSLGFGRQKVGMPFHDMLGFPAHSAFLLEASRKYGEPGNKSWFQNAGIQIFNNTSTGSGYAIRSHIGKNIPLYQSLYLIPEAGLALIHRFHPTQIYQFSDGRFTWVKDSGKLRPGVNTRVSLAYRAENVTLFVSYQLSADLFYNPSVPVLFVNYLQLGLQYNFKSKNP